MRSITAFSLGNTRLAIILIVIIVLGGLYQFMQHPRQEDPTIVIRDAVVTTNFPGMAPDRVEQLITRHVEEQVRTMEEVEEIRSDSKTGTSVVHVKLRDELPPNSIPSVWRDLRNEMADIEGEMPEGTIGPIVNDEFGLTAVATIALWSEGFSLAEMRDTARDLRDRLYAIDGIRKVELFGIQEERIFLRFSNAKLSQYGISPGAIVQTLTDQNIILPGGRIDVLGQDIAVEPSGNFEGVEDIRDLIIPIPNSDRVASLLDVVSIERSYVDPPDKPAFFNGRPAIVLSVSMLDGQNSVEFGNRLWTKVKQLEQELPIGYVLEFATFQPELVRTAVDGALLNVYQALGIVLAVVMIFLGLRTGLIVGSFVPLAMLLGVIFMGLFGIDFNRMSIATMIIALGMLVDNGIVVAEEIRSRLERGQDRREACTEAGRTLAIPLLSSTLTTVFAFAPMLFIDGAAGEYVKSLGQVVMIVLLGSWLLSMYVTPAMCFWFMRVKPKARTANGVHLYDGPIYSAYRTLLNGALRVRLLVLAVVVGALVLAFFGFQFVVKEFFPASDRNQFLVYIDLAAGANAKATENVVQRYVDWLEDKTVNPDVTSSIAYVGSSGPRFFLSLASLDPDPHVAFAIVNTESGEQVPDAIARSRAFLLENFAEATARVKAMWLGGTETGIVQIRLSGPDADVLYENGETIAAAFKAIPGALDVRQDWENRVLKVIVEVDQARARRVGVTSRDVAVSLGGSFDGVEVTEYREGDTVIPVVLRAVDTERGTLTTLADLSVYASASGANVPLSQIANFRAKWQYSRISRFDQQRTITISAKHQFLKAGQLFERIEPTLAGLDLGPAYQWELGGELESSSEAQGSLFGNTPIALIAIGVLLIWQFRSFRRPAIIALTVPLSLIGGIAGLLILDSVFGFMTILGVFTLAGIIINNGIVLIDRIDSLRADGKHPYDALVQASLTRFRPIMMTTLTTVLGLLPLIIFKDPLFFGMAALVAFGLLVGTLLTLVVVPVLYSLFFGVRPAPPVVETQPGPAPAIDREPAPNA